MSITTGATVYQFGTNTNVITTGASDANVKDTFSTAGHATALTQSDYCPLGDAVLTIHLNEAPTAGDAVHLYRRDMNINGTVDDATQPDANWKQTYVGSFALDLVTTIQYISLTDIPLVVDQEFYIEYNITSATADLSAATTVDIRPKSYNTKA